MKTIEKFNELETWKIPKDLISYEIVKFKQRDGKERILEVPNHDLKKVQRIISSYLSKMHHPTINKAFRENWNYILASKQMFEAISAFLVSPASLFESPILFRVDLADFFKSTGPDKFIAEINNYNLKKKTVDNLVKLCFYENKYLPTGSPSSPVLSSIASEHMDRRIKAAMQKYVTHIERYADDYFFLFPSETNFQAALPILNFIIHDSGYRVNKEKTRKIIIRSHCKIMGLVGSFDKDNRLVISIPQRKRNRILEEAKQLKNQKKIDGFLAWGNSIKESSKPMVLSEGTNRFFNQLGAPKGAK